ncbi:MAG TPA: hypothetical protein VGG94_01060 [Chthoniobacterales bacterium]
MITGALAGGSQSSSLTKVLQIVPRIPGQNDGVGIYALIVARQLRQLYGADTIFAAAGLQAPITADGFEVLPLASVISSAVSAERYDHVLLHYVGYGYQARGVPFSLVSALGKLGRHRRGHWLTLFHEIAASGPPWGSAFWLRPFQVRIARSVARLSDSCLVSSESSLARLRRLVTAARIFVQPVPSGFGEPLLSLSQMTGKDPCRWAICGGNALLEKSVHSFRRILSGVPDVFRPRELFVFGGTDSQVVRDALNDLADVKWSYQPRIDGSAASQILTDCAFGWIDYFHHAGAPVDALLKSSVFGALCAHGVIPVMPHPAAPLVLEGDRFPGLFWTNQMTAQLPSTDERVKTSWEIFQWYHRRASAKHLTRVVAGALGLAQESTPSS